MNEEQLAYLKEIAIGKTNDDIAKLMFERFGATFSTYKIMKCKAQHEIQSGPSRKPRKRLLTDEEFEWLKSRCQGKHYEELAEMFKAEFNKEVTPYQLSNFFRKRKVSTGVSGKFEKGKKPHGRGNKLTPAQYAASAPTMFKKGCVPHNKLPIGSERVRGDGYLWVKVAEPKKWRHKHKLLWEKEHGKIPSGMCVSFLDGDRMNCTLDNLVLLLRGERAIMTRMNLGSKDPAIAMTGVLVSKILNLKHQKTKGENK